MLKLTLREMRAHVGRYVLTFAAVAIGVMFMGGMLALTDTITRTFHDLVADGQEWVDVYVQGSQQIEAEFGSSATERPRVDASLADVVDGVDGVDITAPYVEGFARILDSEGEALGGDEIGPPSLGQSWVEVGDLNPWVLTDGSRAPEARPTDDPACALGPAGLMDMVPGDPGDAVAAAEGEAPADLADPDVADPDGSDPDVDDADGAEAEGPMIALPEEPCYEIVLDRTSAEDAGYEIGDTVVFQTTLGSGAAELVGVARYGTADSPFGASVVLFEETVSQELITGEGRANGIGLVAADGVDPEDLRDDVDAVLADRLPAEDHDNLEVITGEALTEQTQSDADEQLGFVRTVLLVFAAIAVSVGAFVIYTSFSFIVAQRQRQTALLRAVGATRRQTVTGVLAESIVVGLLASLAGYGLGVGVAKLLSTIFLVEPAPLVLLPVSAALSLAVGVSVTVASACVPAWRAARVPPMAALRAVEIDVSNRSLGRLVLGILALLAGVAILVLGLDRTEILYVGFGIFLVFFGLVVIGPLAAVPTTRILGRPLALRGVVGRVAARNAERNPKRTAYTGAALMIGLGVVSLILVMNASIAESIDDMVDNRFNGDFVVSGGAAWMGAGVSPEVTGQLNDLPEVEAATGLRFGYAEIEESGEFVAGLDPGVGLELFEVGVVAGDPADLGSDSLAVYVEEAREQGLELGDEVTVTFAETGEQQFDVAVLLDSKDLTGTYLFANDVFDEHLPDTGDAQVWIQLAPGVSPEAATPVLEDALVAAPTADLLDLDEFKEQTKSQLNGLMLMLGVLLALTILVAMIGIVNTLVLSVVERSREIGLTRAVGATRAQMRASIRWEALLIAAFGLSAALAVGVFFGWVIVQALEEEGFRVFVVPYLWLAGVTLMTGTLTLLAALAPAWWGARRPILPAIAAE